MPDISNVGHHNRKTRSTGIAVCSSEDDDDE